MYLNQPLDNDAFKDLYQKPRKQTSCINKPVLKPTILSTYSNLHHVLLTFILGSLFS